MSDKILENRIALGGGLQLRVCVCVWVSTRASADDRIYWINTAEVGREEKGQQIWRIPEEESLNIKALRLTQWASPAAGLCI